MDSVTYPEDRVIRFITENMIPLRVAFDAQPLSADFNIKWTPTLITLDHDGNEHHRTVGFLAVQELIPFQLRQAAIFTLADSDYGRRVSEGLELDMKEVERLSAMSQEERAKATDRGAFGDEL